MLEMGEKPMIGHKIRKLRGDLGLTQSDMAAAIGISASYLNLIEHNQRPVTVPLLFKLGQSFDIDLKDFAADDTTRLMADITEMFADPAMVGHSVSKREMRDFVNSQPNIASALSRFYNNYRIVKAEMQNVAAAGEGQRSPFSTSSLAEDLRIYLQENGNYFAELEASAEDFWQQASLGQETLYADLCRWFLDARGIDVQVVPADVMGVNLRQYDPHKGRILLSEGLRRPRRVFQLLLQVAALTQHDLIEKMVKEADQPHIGGMLRNTLAGYFAGAVMMPYTPFADAARKLRYDIDLIGRRFGVSFEQVCHRLTTLNRPGDRGISFFFIRVDPAGNVSKRLSAGKMQFANHGGTCARWVVHQAFRVPSKILTQVAEIEEGQQVFTMARTVSPQWTPKDQPEPEFAVGLGCNVNQARDIVYADTHDLGKNRKPDHIGIGCHVCERMDCAQRSQPPLGYNIRFDPYRRRLGLFDIES